MQRSRGEWLEKGQGTATTPTKPSLGMLFSLNDWHLFLVDCHGHVLNTCDAHSQHLCYPIS